MRPHRHTDSAIEQMQRSWKPQDDEYVVFLGQFPTRKFIYCLCGDCIASSRKTLLGKLAITLRMWNADKVEMVREFSRRYWLLDVFPSRRKLGSVTQEEISDRVRQLKKMIIEEKGRLPHLVIPAMKGNPTKSECREGRSFGAKVYRSFEEDGDFRGLFRPVYLSPWRKGFKRRVRILLRMSGWKY